MLQWNEGKYYKDWEEMKEWLKDKKLVDEYGSNVDIGTFIRLVESKQDIVDPEPFGNRYDEKLVDGYKFLACEFS